MKKNKNFKILFTLLSTVLFIFLNITNIYAYNAETDSIISNSYNNAWIDSYLDLNMNPTDGIKEFIDSHQDYFNFTSSELGEYWICEKLNDTTNDSYFYYFIFAPAPIYIRYHYNGSATSTGTAGNCEYYTLLDSNAEGNIFTISFVKDGLYASSDVTLVSNDSDSASFSMINQSYHCGVSEHTYVVANHDVKNTTNGETEGSVAFQEPVTKNGTTLAPVIQREKTKGTLQIVLKEIIQILPLIIVVVVSLVGLRKALKMLSQVLHRS